MKKFKEKLKQEHLDPLPPPGQRPGTYLQPVGVSTFNDPYLPLNASFTMKTFSFELVCSFFLAAFCIYVVMTKLGDRLTISGIT